MSVSYNYGVSSMKITYRGKDFSVAVNYSKVSDNWLVFLHGIGCAKECFDEVFKTDLAQKYSILTFDFVGFGDSDKPEDFEYTLEQHAEITKLLIEQFNPHAVSIVAHSMGGTIGLILAQKLQDLDWFVNLEGNLISKDAGIVSRRTAEQTEVDFVQSGYDTFLKNLKQSDDSAFQVWAKWYENSSRVAVYRSGASLVEWSDGGMLPGYFTDLKKKAFIHGDKTGISHLVGVLKDIRTISIPNSGHFMMLDNPKVLYEEINNLLG